MVSGEKYDTVETLPQSKWKTIERGKIDPLTQIYVRSLSGLGTDTWMKCGGVKLFLSTQTSSLSDMMRPYKCFPHVRLVGLWRSTPLMQTLAYKPANSVIIKNDIKIEKLKFPQLGFLYYCIKCIIWVNGNTYFNNDNYHGR